MIHPMHALIGTVWQKGWHNDLSRPQCPTRWMMAPESLFVPASAEQHHCNMCFHLFDYSRTFLPADPNFVQLFRWVARSFSAFLQKNLSYPYLKILPQLYHPFLFL